MATLTHTRAMASCTSSLCTASSTRQLPASSFVGARRFGKACRLSASAIRSSKRNAVAINALFGGPAPKQHVDPSFVVLYPEAFSEAPTAITALQSGSTVILNLCNMESLDDQQRSVDFIAGGTHALEGSQWSLSDQIFLFTPPEVQVADLKMQKNSLAEAIRTMLHKDDPNAQLPEEFEEDAATAAGTWGGEWDEGEDDEADLSFLYQEK